MSIFVPLRKQALETLRELARRERRRPADQAAILLERSLGLDGDAVPRRVEREEAADAA